MKKKIACFVAMPHHTRFMRPVLDRLENQGHEVIYFTTLSDYPFERDPLKYGKRCELIQDYGSPELSEKVRSFQREFFAEWVKKIFAAPKMTQWGLNLQSNLITSGMEDYWLLAEFLDREKPDVVMILHERNRWGKQLGHLCWLRGIPFVEFQEGDYYEDRLSFSTHAEYGTAVLVWGEEAKARLVRHGCPKEKVYVVGNTHLATVDKKNFNLDDIRKEVGIASKKPVVVMLVEVYWGMLNVPEVWQKVFAGFPFDDFEVVISWHPKIVFNSFSGHVAPMFKKYFPQVHLFHAFDTYKLTELADYVVIFGRSTTAVEVAWWGKPLFTFPEHDSTEDLYEQWGISHSLRVGDNWDPFKEVVLKGESKEHGDHVRTFLDRYFHCSNRVAVSRSVELVNCILETPKKELDKSPKEEYSWNMVPKNLPRFSSEEDQLRFFVQCSGTSSKNEKYLEYLQGQGL